MRRALIAGLLPACLRRPERVGADLPGVRRDPRDPRGQRVHPSARKTPSSVWNRNPGSTPAPVVGTVAQFHFGGGKSEGWSFGAAGTPEMQTRLGETYYEVTVAMDSGDKRTVQRKDGNRFYVGQRVALRSGELEPMQP